MENEYAIDKIKELRKLVDKRQETIETLRELRKERDKLVVEIQNIKEELQHYIKSF